MKSKILTTIQGYETQDGAGVKLVRVLGPQTVEDFDPILMLDSFDSENPADYMAGFPEHPHRGIETISYVYRGQMTHEDSLGNKDTIQDGEVQWMTAGSGIIHSETLPASEKLLGVQLWLNLPSKDKMCAPAYHAIKNDAIPEIELEGGKLRVLTGEFNGQSGFQAKYLPLNYFDIHLDEGASIHIPTESSESLMIFTLDGEAKIAGERIPSKTAVKVSTGGDLEIEALSQKAQVLWISSEHLGEKIAWGGPIVMNTQEELRDAFYALQDGSFIQEEASMDKG